MGTIRTIYEANGLARTIIAAVLVGTVTALLILGREVPSEAWGIVGAVIGFYFARPIPERR